MAHGFRTLIALVLISFPAIGNDGMPEGATKALMPGVNGVTQPKRQRYVAPEYPKAHLATRVEARVIVQVIVQADGTVSRDVDSLKCEFRTGPDGEYTVVSKDKCKRFDSAAKDAVRLWRFKPATKNGNAVDVFYIIALRLEPK